MAGRIRALLRRAAPAMPDLRDLHVYGGGLLIALGASLAFAPAGPMAFGALLLYLGLKGTRA